MSPPLVYLSFRYDGAERQARLLARWLREQGVDVFVFVDYAIQSGQNWPTALQENLERSSALIVLIDQNWLRHADDFGRRKIDNDEDWVHREIAHALSNRKSVLPVLLDDANMPPASALSEPLRGLAEKQAVRLRSSSFDEDVNHIRPWLDALRTSESDAHADAGRPIRVEKVSISGFRCYERLEINLSQPSTLSGEWTCIAGTNGAGKSSILQAISLLLMGPENARELGGKLLQSMRHRSNTGSPATSVLRAWVRHFSEERYLELVLDDKGAHSTSESWGDAESLLTVGYGAGRNLSDSSDRWVSASDMVRAHISLFDPMARLSRAEVLLEDNDFHAQGLFANLVSAVFSQERLSTDSTGRFSMAGARVKAVDLPDGFRSSAAWMADFCVRAALVNQSWSALEDISGIVLIDELDLHLHASLQRSIIPRLRQALPNVQFIVTSHSPLILSSFDRNELVLLDRDEPDGVRTLDRQILGFSSDDVYNWLMETPPHSEVLDRKVEGEDSDLSALFFQNPKTSEAEALERDRRQAQMLKEMGYEEGAEV